MSRDKRVSLDGITEALKPLVAQIAKELGDHTYSVWSDEALEGIFIKADGRIEVILRRAEADLGLAYWRKLLRPRLEAIFNGGHGAP